MGASLEFVAKIGSGHLHSAAICTRINYMGDYTKMGDYSENRRLQPIV